MNKGELQAKLHNYEERLKDIAKAIKETREQLAEAEKSKLRHGDFGLKDEGNCCSRIFLSQSVEGFDWGKPTGDHREYSEIGIMTDVDFTVLGNVFDLMKGWSEPFKEYGTDKYATGIKIEDNGIIRMYACTGSDCKKEKCFCGLSLNEAEEFHNALGHAIADLKRKENK